MGFYSGYNVSRHHFKQFNWDFNPPMRSYLRAMILIALICKTNSSVGSSAVPAKSCAITYFLYKNLSDKIIVTGSSNGLKELNDKVFKGQNSRSEVVLSVLHSLFKQQLATEFLDLELYKMTALNSSTIKYNQLSITCHNDCRYILTSLLARARKTAVEKAALFFETGNKSILDIYGESYKLPDNNQSLTLPPKSEVNHIGAELKKYYGGWRQVQAFFDKNYTIGLGINPLDSLFGARLATSRVEPIVEFDLSDFIFQLELAKSRQNSLGWLFEKQSNKGLFETFSLIRKNSRFYHIRDTSEQYQYRLANFKALEISDTAALQAAHKSIVEYAQRLKIFGYLPSHLIPKNETAKEKFNSLPNPTVIGHTDIIGLGAHALLSSHNQLSELYAKSLLLEDALTKALSNSTTGITGILADELTQIKTLYESLLHDRANIFAKTNEFLLLKEAELKSTLAKMGIDDSALALWSAGDDIFFAINKEGITAEQVAVAIKSNPDIGRHFRVVTRNILPGTKNLELHKVRQDLGAATEPLKAIESTNPQEDFAAVYQGTSKNRLKILRFQMSGKNNHANQVPVDRASLAEFENFTPNEWKLEP